MNSVSLIIDADADTMVDANEFINNFWLIIS